jgi:hypothetical protein
VIVEIPLNANDPQLVVKRFYYTQRLSISLLQDIEVPVDSLEFFFIHEDTTIERLEVPVTPLYRVDELWIDLEHEIPEAKLYTRKVLDRYSYRLISPF